MIEALRNGFFRIALDNGHETLGYTAGKMRRYRIRIFPGDRIKVELSAYDLGAGASSTATLKLSVRGKDAGSARIRWIRARLRTPHRAVHTRGSGA